ncbi:MAG: potassium-transporting ATPase subunit KdpC [Herpetosiphon sp.]
MQTSVAVTPVGTGLDWKGQLRAAVTMLAFLTLLTGLLYPALVTGLAQVLFPRQANGSLLMRGNQVVGSTLIGQHFDDPRYFWGRPSATDQYANNPLASGGSNLGPLNPKLADAVRERVAALRAADPGNQQPVPGDLVTASGSGLDPHISIAAATYQAARVARVRGLDAARVDALVRQYTNGRTFGLLGEPRVNVLELNLALDGGK